MMLSSASIDSFSPPSSVGITMILCSYMTDTCNKNLETNCGPAFLSRDNLKQ